MSDTFYSYDTENPLSPVIEWEKFDPEDRKFISIRQKKDHKEVMYLIREPENITVGALFFTKSPTEAENARRTSILSRMSEIKRTRAKLAAEMRKIKDEVDSWSLDNIK